MRRRSPVELLRGKKMKMIAAFLDHLAANESGATMVEYTILIGLITVVSIALIAAVGNWVRNSWTVINSTVAANSITT
jgi:pilus assembly protein Flp/PilA